MASMKLTIEIDADWLALNVYRCALERIAEEAKEDPFGFQGQDARAIAELVLEQFPGSGQWRV
jgi:hypothetical protein